MDAFNLMLPLREGADARIVIVAGKRYRLDLADGTRIEAVARKRLFASLDHSLVVGDLVKVSEDSGQWVIEAVLPRLNEFVRRGLRDHRQVLFANVDRVLILASLAQPATKPASVDRFLVAALNGGIAASLVLTKTDLDPERLRQRELREQYDAFDLPVYAISNVTGEGIHRLEEEISAGISAGVGNSGVGKSALLNRLIPGLNQRVQEISEWSGKGVHTTTSALFVSYGDRAALIDTPGVKSFTPYGITRERLIEFFPDVARHASDCRFRNCRHVSEPGCAVREAAEDGRLVPSRLRSFHRLQAEFTE